uniref:hypothetical protein n=1 Tax=Bakuella subtropica TaxID=1295181 RepID=UPI0023F27F16|nr:hypothetical protein P4D19_mgp04 [Bakuella subtropica]WDY80897.1 hypothetical protein BKSUB_61 [Bakuella subtropica]
MDYTNPRLEVRVLLFIYMKYSSVRDTNEPPTDFFATYCWLMGYHVLYPVGILASGYFLYCRWGVDPKKSAMTKAAEEAKKAAQTKFPSTENLKNNLDQSSGGAKLSIAQGDGNGGEVQGVNLNGSVGGMEDGGLLSGRIPANNDPTDTDSWTFDLTVTLISVFINVGSYLYARWTHDDDSSSLSDDSIDSLNSSIEIEDTSSLEFVPQTFLQQLTQRHEDTIRLFHDPRILRFLHWAFQWSIFYAVSTAFFILWTYPFFRYRNAHYRPRTWENRINDLNYLDSRGWLRQPSLMANPLITPSFISNLNPNEENAEQRRRIRILSYRALRTSQTLWSLILKPFFKR